jgi:hypothetical protein
MEPFLDRSAFAAADPDDRGTDRPLVGRASFNGVVVFANWSREEATAVLAEDLELARNAVAPTRHPLAFIIGEQTRGALTYGPFTIATGIGYHEVGVAVPFVRHRRDAGLHTYIPRMYSSFFPAVWNGNTHYGFGKELGHMERDGGGIVVHGGDGRPRLRLEVEATGGWVAGRDCLLPNFAAMRAIFALPVIGRQADGRYVRSRFHWSFEEASVRPARVKLAIEASLGPGLDPRSCPTVPGGAFDVRAMVWRLSWPAPWPR